jgi:hypothetical protein
MMHFLFNLPNVWTNMLSTQILCFLNISSNFEYVLITNNKHVLLGGLDNIPNFIPGTKLYPIHNLELVLIMDTPEPTLLNDLLELLSNCIEDQSLSTLDGTFSAFVDQLESN